jgi:hypothetical protein
MTAKASLRHNPIVRELVRQNRLRRGHPDWRSLTPEALERLEENRDGKRALIATVGGGYLAGSRMESLLALALAARGCESHVLLCDGAMPACLECNSDWYPNQRAFARRGPGRMHCRACFGPAEKMFRNAGVHVYRYGELLSEEDRRDARARTGDLTVDELVADVSSTARIGEHAMAGALRYFARGTLPVDGVGEAVLRRYFEAALLTQAATERLLESQGYDVAVFSHGIYVPHGVIGDVARAHGVRVVNWHVAYRAGCFIFSHGDTYHHTLVSEPVATWEDMDWSPELDHQIDEYLKSRWFGTNDWIVFHDAPELDVRAVERETGIDLSRPSIGMLTNVLWDAQLHYPANAFPTLLDWAARTIRYFAERRDLQLLIRVHPGEVSGTLRSREPFLDAVRNLTGSLPPNVFVIPPESRLSTYAAMSACDSVLIYGTKTGVELTAMGIPVIVAGEAWIRDKGLTLDAKSPEHYTALLDRLPLGERLDAETVERARKYAFHFFFRRMIPLEFARPTERVQGGFQFEVSNLEDLAPGRSAGLDVICDGILHEAPFVFEAEKLLAHA